MLPPPKQFCLLFLALSTHMQYMLTCMKERLPAIFQKKKHNVGFHFVRRSQPRPNFEFFAGLLNFFKVNLKAGSLGYHNINLFQQFFGIINGAVNKLPSILCILFEITFPTCIYAFYQANKKNTT